MPLLYKIEQTIVLYSNRMANSWRVILNSKLWNQEKYEEDFYLNPQIRRLPQSKGRKDMKVVPKKGDQVRFVYKKRVVMKGIVDSDGFEYGSTHQNHSCNIGANRPHALSNIYVWIHITEVGLSDYIRPTGQLTWIQYKDDMGIKKGI